MTIIDEFLKNDTSLPAVVANLVAHGAMSADNLDMVLSKRAEERRAAGESFFQSYNKCFATTTPRDPIGKELLQLQNVVKRYGQAAAEQFVKAKSKVSPAKGDDGKLAAPDTDYDFLFQQFRQKNASLSLGRAHEMFMRTPEGAKAYAEQKEARLRKSAALTGGGYA
jgi:hypothetical protein